jgi:GNAT superfamily N-acetyltransferase
MSDIIDESKRQNLPMSVRRHFIEAPPSVPDYMKLRRETGLEPRSEAAAAKGLPNSLFALTIYDHDEAIGMGRILGDGGTFFYVADIAVLPAYQKQGLGTEIMQRLMAWLDQNAPKGSYTCLFADEGATSLYEKFGFKSTDGLWYGMVKFIE